MSYPVLPLDRIHNRHSFNTSFTYDFFIIGCTPHEEPCTQAGGDNNDSIAECTAFINLMIHEIGEPPEGAEWLILENFHETEGYYHEAVVLFREAPDNNDTDYTESGEYALEAEASVPDHWDERARTELRILGHSLFQPAKVVDIRKSA